MKKFNFFKSLLEIKRHTNRTPSEYKINYNSVEIITALNSTSNQTNNASTVKSQTAITQPLTQIINITSATTMSTSTKTTVSNITDSYQDGSIEIKWTNNGIDSTNFTITCESMNQNSYCAFGLSNDQFMGNDNIAVCKISNGVVQLMHLYSTEEVRPEYLSATNEAIGFSNIVTSLTNNAVKCLFTRAKTMTGVQNYFNLTKQYYILTSSGVVLDGNNSNEDI